MCRELQTKMFQDTMTIALEELEECGHYTKESKETAIREAITVIHSRYGSERINTIEASELDFSQIKFRSAYLYCYFTSHVSLITNLWTEFSEKRLVQDWLSRNNSLIQICSLGGGPGCDLFGFCSFLKSINFKAKVHCDILDRWKQWENTYKRLAKQTGMAGNSTVYHQFDFLQSDYKDTILQKISSADLVTLIKFVSAVGYDKRYCEHQLMELLGFVKRGAFVLFVDNCGGGYLNIMNRIAYTIGLQFVHRCEKKSFSVSPHEKTKMDEWRNSVKKQPQKSTQVCVALWYKTKETNPQPIKTPTRSFPSPPTARRSFPSPLTARRSFPSPLTTRRSFPSPLTTRRSFPSPLTARRSFPSPLTTRRSFPSAPTARRSFPSPPTPPSSLMSNSSQISPNYSSWRHFDYLCPTLPDFLRPFVHRALGRRLREIWRVLTEVITLPLLVNAFGVAAIAILRWYLLFRFL